MFQLPRTNLSKHSTGKEGCQLGATDWLPMHTVPSTSVVKACGLSLGTGVSNLSRVRAGMSTSMSVKGLCQAIFFTQNLFWSVWETAETSSEGGPSFVRRVVSTHLFKSAFATI